MPEEGFLRRWARVKASGAEAVAEAPPAAAVAIPDPVASTVRPDALAPAEPQQSAPTLVDAARLTLDSDFSAFVSPGVDKDVRRLALKKLFADPHFNVLDRLDMYMDDYNKPDPVSATMLAALDHARSTLRRPEEVQAEIARLTARDAPAEVAGVAPAAPDALPEDEAGASDEADELGDTAGAGDDRAPEQAPVAAEASILADAAASDSDVIALTIVRAHNAQACP